MTLGTKCRVFNLQDLLSGDCRKHSMILKNTFTLLMKLNSEKRKFSFEKSNSSSIYRTLMLVISATVDKKETKPNQLSESWVGCQSREQA